MCSKQEIKNLLVAELTNTPHYQVILMLKQIILNEIATPNVQDQVIYNFETPQTEYDIKVLQMCMVLEFGFLTNNISSNCMVIEMSDFIK